MLRAVMPMSAGDTFPRKGTSMIGVVAALTTCCAPMLARFTLVLRALASVLTASVTTWVTVLLTWFTTLAIGCVMKSKSPTGAAP